MKKLVVLTLLTLSITLGCAKEDPVSPPMRGSIVEPTDELITAPTSLVIEKTLTLTADIWRDFMPSTMPGGKRMIAVFHVVTADSSEFPRGVTADSAWVIFGDKAWWTPVSEERPRAPDSATLEVVAREGPKWGPDVLVDAVLLLRDSTGQRHLLRAPGQLIYGTY